LRGRRAFAFKGLEPKTGYGQRSMIATTQQTESDMTIERAVVFSILLSAVAAGSSGPAVAQACTRQGVP
jgi:hypothetical protein